MPPVVARTQYRFLRHTVSWRFWAFGYHTQRIDHGIILTIGIGPLRLQFIDTAEKWEVRPWEQGAE